VTPLFKKIGLAIAFSPRAEAMLAEAVRLKNIWKAELVLIHVGEHGETEKQLLDKLLSNHNLSANDVIVCWRKGKPAKEILKACNEQGIDLLVTGALRKEGLVQHYVGSIARRILRKANCSVLTLIQPSVTPAPFDNIVVSADDYDLAQETLRQACLFAHQEQARWLHVAREVKLYGLSMSSADQATEEEYTQLRHKLIEDEIDHVQRLLGKANHAGLKINIKILSGKSGFELAQFAKRKNANLLIVSAPPRRLMLLDRIFPHDLEYVFAELPCNLLIVNPDSRYAHG
jgi:nucleotide-binding universal stress UspA family protein